VELHQAGRVKRGYGCCGDAAQGTSPTAGGKIAWEGDLDQSRRARDQGRVVGHHRHNPCGSIPARQPEPGDTVAGSGLQRQGLGLTDLILCEVLQGIREQRAFARVRADLLSSRFLRRAAGPGDCGRSELPRLGASALHRSQDHRLPHRTFCCRAGTNCCIRITISIALRRCLGCSAACGGVNPCFTRPSPGSGFVLKLVWRLGGMFRRTATQAQRAACR